MEKIQLKVLLALLTFLSANSTNSQDRVIYYDALDFTKLYQKYQENVKPDNPPASIVIDQEVVEVLRYYFHELKVSGADPQRVVATNPFLKDIFDTQPGSQSIQGAAKSLLKTTGSIAGSVGGLNVTNFADGMARFLVKRMKEELSIAFFDQFEQELEKQEDFQKLFPATWSILKVAKNEIYNYQTYLPALREAFEYDLDEFFTNSYAWSISPEADLPILTELKKNAQLHNALKLLLFAGRDLDKGVHPGDILTRVANESEIKFETIDINLRAYFRIADLLSQSLRSDSQERYWITKDEAQEFSGVLFIRIYLGLLYQKCPNDLTLKVNGTDTSLKEILKKLASNINTIQDELKKIANDVARAEESILKITQTGADKKGSDYFAAASSLTEIVSNVVNSSFNPSTRPEAKAFEEVKFYSEHGSYLFANIESRAYNSGVFEAYIILDHALPNQQEALKKFLKYGTFMATVATAQSSQEVADAIESVALPVGSASIKRKTKSNIALNAYIGLSGGAEWNGATREWKGIFGVNSPIGVAFSRGHYKADSKCTKERGSSSLFVSLIDIGAFSTFRFDDSKTETLPEVTLSNIFAPGLYYVYGIPKAPVSLGIGGQLGPQLREITDAAAVTESGLNASLRMFLAVDIPLLNFKTKPRP